MAITLNHPFEKIGGGKPDRQMAPSSTLRDPGCPEPLTAPVWDAELDVRAKVVESRWTAADRPVEHTVEIGGGVDEKQRSCLTRHQISSASEHGRR
jgi:hypothetical protein